MFQFVYIAQDYPLFQVERTKLLTHLRERAVEIGEKGARFLGMDPQQMGLVLEFVSNLKSGNTDLPLNDRSKELLDQITLLKSEREVDRVTIERWVFFSRHSTVTPCSVFISYYTYMIICIWVGSSVKYSP